MLGPAQKLIGVIAGDTRGTFHGLGALDNALRTMGTGLEQSPVELRGRTNFVSAESGAACSDQEALYYSFGLPLAVIAEPSRWYAYHRRPKIIEAGEGRSRVLVRFLAESFSGEQFGGTCLYACRDGRWGAYPIKPSESRDIATAEAWLTRRKWQAWA
jgi:hypothetical protein